MDPNPEVVLGSAIRMGRAPGYCGVIHSPVSSNHGSEHLVLKGAFDGGKVSSNSTKVGPTLDAS